MGTRSGTIDPAILTYMMELKNMTHKEIEKILNKDSGLLGLSEISSDMRVLEEAMKNDERAKRAIDIFCHKIIQTIGSYVAELNGIDAIVFTGGIGENDFIVRKIVCESLNYLGLTFDSEKNEETWKKGRQTEGELSKEDSKIKVFVIPTNEELQMVRSATRIL
jgi:acetate kinase